MPKIIVASQNPVKLEATLEAFKSMFPQQEWQIEGVKVPSGVSNQPRSDKETLEGAINRATNAQTVAPNADFWVGVEGGIIENDQGMNSFAWMVIKNKSELLGKAKTGTFILPDRIAKLIKEGKEFGEANDIVFKQENSKQNMGGVGLLTQGVIDRTAFYTHAAKLALIPFKNQALYKNIKVYFAGSDKSGSNLENNYPQIITCLKQYAEVLTEHVEEEQLTLGGENPEKNEAIFKRDLEWLQSADIIVAEVTTPSLGVGYELAQAEKLQKPTLCLYQRSEGKQLPAMISGNENFKIIEYNNLEEIELILQEIFSEISILGL